MKHIHRANPKLQATFGWTHCVAVGSCSGKSHGGITQRDECNCGAIRLTEINGFGRDSERRGLWIEKSER